MLLGVTARLIVQVSQFLSVKLKMLLRQLPVGLHLLLERLLRCLLIHVLSL